MVRHLPTLELPVQECRALGAFGQVLLQCRWQLTTSPRLNPTSFVEMGLPEEAVKKPSALTLYSRVVKLIRIKRR